MRKLIEKKLLPYVIKPGRYAGGEPGQIVKNPDGRLKYLHAYADMYEIGQSYLGLQTLYHVVNKDNRFLCERVYAVGLDAEELMRKESIPLFSLESSRPAREFDVFGFTLVDETVYTNMLTMLDLSGMAVRWADREDSDPIIIVGGPAVYNPEPLAPFVDLFFIGDAEEGLPEMLGILHEMHGKSKEQKLEVLATRVESVYVPRFYDPQAKPKRSFAREKINARAVPELKPEYYPDQPILPLIDTVHNHLGVEIMRGCPRGCRFCLAGPIYRPVRNRPVSEICNQVETQINNTGYHEITLLALSATDYPELEKLATTLSSRLESRRVSLSMPSLRPGSVSQSLLKSVMTVRRSSLTIAPEAGTERLRLFVGKDFPDEAIYDSVHVAFTNGWTTIKLYFMIGLPSETEEDLLGIADICRNVQRVCREYSSRATINVALSPFVPKSHTPFQWDGVASEEQVYEKIKFIKRHGRLSHVNFKHNDTKLAMLVTVLGRGGQEMADVIESAFRKGCRFDSWSEHFSFDKWLEALTEHGVDPHERLKAIPFTTELPWSHIAKGPSVEHLIRQREKASKEPHAFTPKHEGAEGTAKPDASSMGFGRGRKRLPNKAQVAPTKNRVRLRWGKSARYRYMSHLENLRLLERTLRRAGVPVLYSQGYNPVMRLSLGPPLPLGFTSEAEFLDILLETPLMPYMIDNLRKSLPEGIDIHDAKAVFGKKTSLNAALNRAVYSTPADFLSSTDRLSENINRVLTETKLEVERHGKKETKTVDIRPAVYDLSIVDEKLVMVLGLGEGGYAKPTELMELLSDGLNYPTAAVQFHRSDMYRIDNANVQTNAMDL